LSEQRTAEVRVGSRVVVTVLSDERQITWRAKRWAGPSMIDGHSAIRSGGWSGFNETVATQTPESSFQSRLRPLQQDQKSSEVIVRPVAARSSFSINIGPMTDTN